MPPLLLFLHCIALLGPLGLHGIDRMNVVLLEAIDTYWDPVPANEYPQPHPSCLDVTSVPFDVCETWAVAFSGIVV